MCNAEIITNELLLRGIEEECHTYAMWKSLGYQVQRGQEALFQTSIWKCVSGKNKEELETDGEKKSNQKMFLKKASFFGRSQVEPIDKNKK